MFSIEGVKDGSFGVFETTGWGPQDSVQLPEKSGFMVDITIFIMGL
jgi:hypothetical protein